MLTRSRLIGCRWRSLRRRVEIRYFLVSTCVLIGGLSCPSETVRAPRARPEPAPAPLVLFFSGSTLGALKPCGCSGGQLGGIEKRPAIFGEVPASERLILDTGSLVQGDREQDLIKFRVLFEAFRLLGYDAVSLTRQDLEVAQTLGLLGGQEYPFELISSLWRGTNEGRRHRLDRQFRLQGRDITVSVATFDARTDVPEQAAALFESAAGGARFNVLILQNSDSDSAVAWTEASGADCIVCSSTSDEPQILSKPGATPLVFTVGRLGRHLCRVQVDFSRPDGSATAQLTDIPVSEDLPEEPALVQLYKQYQQLVAAANLLENYPRVPLPDGLKYAGSKSCESCHLYEYAMWHINPHADAFATLVEVGSDRDPECVVCHVVGMDRDSGFITAEKTPGWKDVGCENCHGPGSAHNASQGLTLTTEPKSTCLDCHTPEHSSGYTGHEDEYREKIMHWWEP